jgi:hypothetical protein
MKRLIAACTSSRRWGRGFTPPISWERPPNQSLETGELGCLDDSAASSCGLTYFTGPADEELYDAEARCRVFLQPFETTPGERLETRSSA